MNIWIITKNYGAYLEIWLPTESICNCLDQGSSFESKNRARPGCTSTGWKLARRAARMPTPGLDQRVHSDSVGVEFWVKIFGQFQKPEASVKKCYKVFVKFFCTFLYCIVNFVFFEILSLQGRVPNRPSAILEPDQFKKHFKKIIRKF